MPQLQAGQLLRRHATPFIVTFALLTGLLLVNFAVRQLPLLSARDGAAGDMVRTLLLAIPFTIALTIPMAVFVAVLRVFTRLGAEGAIDTARRERDGIRRLVVPVLGGATVVAALMLVSNTRVLPQANEQLSAVLSDGAPQRSDRTMTIAELREAARSARAEAGAEGLTHAVTYEVEIQKKFALAAACVVLALAGMAVGIRFPRGGVGLVIAASVVVFGAYYACLIAGESLADRLVVSPIIAMWMANAFLLTGALLVMWRSTWPGATRGARSLAMGG